VLEYLVTSKARRRLLSLLWGQEVRASASQLADLAGVRFAGAHRELRGMLRHQLVDSTYEGGAQVYFANHDHPDCNLLRRLVASRPPVAPPRSAEADALRASLQSLGAPLRGPMADVPPQDLETTLVAGVKLARRDPVVARALPLCLWRQRDALDPRALALAARREGEKHALGFFLELTGELSGNPRFARWAASLLDRRVQTKSPFFHLPATRASAELARQNEFPIANRWGFTMTTNLDSFRALFDKFAHASA
jgi:hypothetical protein